MTNQLKVHRLPLPLTMPPFDDERPGEALDEFRSRRNRLPARHVQGTLALQLTALAGPPAMPPIPAPLLVEDEPASSAVQELPDAKRWAARVAVAALECLYGPRPVQQLLRWTDERVYEDLAGRVGNRGSTTSAIKGKVRTVRVCWPAPDVVEATVVAQAGPRVRSVAIRLEARYRHWLCTALDII
jgi:hypothetical protein